ncbi:BQ2448_4458 [Microbotryum intermedium]|uniref:BQ2448_4458 protein n=1 Tax=Microbotryum intermedium TaxID=269621 RepID=A0A238FIR1_9BASI|nr:BQ2448_4458 [Microbotryum intermedium]
MPGTVAEFNTWITDFKSVAQEIIDARQPSTTFLPRSFLQLLTPHLWATSPLTSSKNSSLPADQLASLATLLSKLTAAALGTTSSGATHTTFPKHARLDGSKSFANWTRQLCLCLAQMTSAPMSSTTLYLTTGALQRSARDAVARNIIANSIKSATVLAVFDKIPR